MKRDVADNDVDLAYRQGKRSGDEQDGYFFKSRMVQCRVKTECVSIFEKAGS